MFVTWRDSFLEAFDSMDRDLRKHASIDCFCSGSTAVTVLKQVFYSFSSLHCTHQSLNILESRMAAIYI